MIIDIVAYVFMEIRNINDIMSWFLQIVCHGYLGIIYTFYR